MSLIVPPGAGSNNHQGKQVTFQLDPGQYLEDRFCPFTSGMWGGPAVVARQVGAGQVVQEVATANGTTYSPCHAQCKLFIRDPECGPKDKPRGACAVEQAARGAMITQCAADRLASGMEAMISELSDDKETSE